MYTTISSKYWVERVAPYRGFLAVSVQGFPGSRSRDPVVAGIYSNLENTVSVKPTAVKASAPVL